MSFLAMKRKITLFIRISEIQYLLFGFPGFYNFYLDLQAFRSTIQTKTFFIWISRIFIWVSPRSFIYTYFNCT
jgi:hypothetical protein